MVKGLTTAIKDAASVLGLSGTKEGIDSLLIHAEQSDMTHAEFLNYIFSQEIKYRTDRAKEKRIKESGLPYIKTLEDFDVSFQKSISAKQLKQLSELKWIEQTYNLMFFGPPGVGKTHLSIALAYKAALEGYRVVFTTMTSLMQSLRTAEISKRSKTKLNRIYHASLVVIDEVGYLPIERTDANLFFQLVTDLHEQASIVITTNKGFEEWTEFLGDPALTTAVLDRLTYRCDMINLEGRSYRLENHKSFLKQLENN